MSLPQFKQISEFAKKEKAKFKKKKSLPKKIFWLFFRLGLLGVAVGTVILIILFAWYSKDLPNPNKLMERTIAQSTKIYDNKGETVLYEIHGEEKRTMVKLEEIPDYVKWATISVEDKLFYEHSGFNLFAMIKGTVWDPLRGRRARGGSTLTQQFVKNAILTDERSIERKIKEFILSYRIEQKFTKDEILQMYLNEIPYGSTSYGIGAAAQTFFGKEVDQLTLAEAALLAGLPKAPTYYSPYGNNLDDLFARQQYVLDRMVEDEHITAEEAEVAKQEELHFRLKKESIMAPHFVMYVKDQLVQMYGDKVVEQGGLKVITTLDLEKQKIAEEAVVAGVDKRGKEYGFTNAALVALDPNSGEILAMVGSKDYFDATIDGNVNVTTRLRQPGSSIKPLIYAEAFKKGYTPDTILFDVNTKFKTDTKDYEPKNYSLKENGPVTMRKALQGSLNIPAVKTMYLAGVDNALNFLEMMGYTSFEDRGRFGLAVVLGGGEVKLIEHAAAYGVFADEGIYHAPAAILTVEDSQGKTLFEFEDKKREALDPNIARMMSNVLSDNNSRAYIFGTNNSLVLSGRPVAAKTGTTNDYHDAWTMGYTPSLVAGVWVGNNNNDEMNRGADGSIIAAPIWKDFMSRATQGLPVEKFPDYQPPQTDKSILSGNFAIEKVIKIDRFSGKLATDYTPPSAIEERAYKQVHNILHYVDKDNPRGPTPTTPKSDIQYNNWEAAVQAWVAKKKTSEDPKEREEYQFINEAFPEVYDDIHIPENKPTVFLTSPSNNDTINSNYLTAAVNASAPRGIFRLEYYLDDILIQTAYAYPYSLNYQISTAFVNGYHKLKAVAYDDVDNSNQVEVDINILAQREQPRATWVFPANGQTFQMSQFPLTIIVKLNDLLAVQKVNFYKRAAGGTFENFSSEIVPSQQNITINLPVFSGAGTYELMAEVETKTGEKVASEIISIIVQ